MFCHMARYFSIPYVQLHIVRLVTPHLSQSSYLCMEVLPILSCLAIGYSALYLANHKVPWACEEGQRHIFT